jgi:hypothetical protein
MFNNSHDDVDDDDDEKQNIDIERNSTSGWESWNKRIYKVSWWLHSVKIGSDRINVQLVSMSISKQLNINYPFSFYDFTHMCWKRENYIIFCVGRNWDEKKSFFWTSIK